MSVMFGLVFACAAMGFVLWDARSHRERLTAIIEHLTDHRARVERVEAGLTETPAPPKKLLPQMPDQVRAWIKSQDGPIFQEQARKDAINRAKADGDWDGVLAAISKGEG